MQYDTFFVNISIFIEKHSQKTSLLCLKNVITSAQIVQNTT